MAFRLGERKTIGFRIEQKKPSVDTESSNATPFEIRLFCPATTAMASRHSLPDAKTAASKNPDRHRHCNADDMFFSKRKCLDHAIDRIIRKRCRSNDEHKADHRRSSDLGRHHGRSALTAMHPTGSRSVFFALDCPKDSIVGCFCDTDPHFVGFDCPIKTIHR